MSEDTGAVVWLIFTAVWIAGIVLAKGFWSCLAALFIPPWALYLVVERAMQLAGMI